MQPLVDLFGFLSVVLRAGTLVFQSLLLGGIVFVLWIARDMPGNPESIEKMQSGSWTLLRCSTIGLIVMQGLYLYVNSAVLMTTAEIGFRAVLGANFFLSGSIVLAAAVAAYLVARQQWKVAHWLLPVLAMTVLGASVMTNHAASRLDGRPLLIILTTIHEAATAFWIGGLPFLVLALFRDKEEEARWHITERFSRVALVSVGAIVFSGMGMSIRYIASWRAVLGTAYGVMVTAKVLMLAALMLLGGINFWLLRSTSKDRVMPRLRRLIEVEVGIGITVILTAASLTSQPPAVDQPNDTVTFHQIMQRMKPTLPRLTYPQVADASISASGREATVSDVRTSFRLPTTPTASRSRHRGSHGRWSRSRTITGWGWSCSPWDYWRCWPAPARQAGRNTGRCCWSASPSSSSSKRIPSAGRWAPKASGRAGPTQRRFNTGWPRWYALPLRSLNYESAGANGKTIAWHSSSRLWSPPAEWYC